MKNVAVGKKYWRISDMSLYEVAHEDSLCFYLCIFNGSCSKIISMSKKHQPLELIFVETYEDMLVKRIDIAKKALASARDDKEIFLSV